MGEQNTKKTKGSAYSQPDYIKPKSKWTKKTTIWCIVILVVILGILAIIGAENGWFKTQDMINGKIELDDYSTIEVEQSAVEVTDETVDSYLNSIVTAETTYEDVTEGTVEDGDSINLDYTGVLEGEEEPFEGGTAAGSTLTLGSGTMIEGFEDQIVGHEIGETFDINVTFPEDYTTEDLQGRNATFTITINSKSVANVPELTDELIHHYAEENLDEEIGTIDEMKEYYRNRLYNSRLETEIMRSLQEKAHVKYYNEADLAALTAYNESSLAYYSSMYGMDSASLASMYGFDSIAAYAESESKNTLDQTMIIDKIAEEQNITYTDEELNEKLTNYMESEGFTGTIDEFKEQSGDAFLFLVSETEVLMPKVLEQMKNNVVFVESPEEETEAAEEAAEAVDEVASDAADAVEGAADEAAEAVEGAAEEAVEAVEEVASEAADAVEGAAEEAAAAVEEVASDAADAVEGAVDGAAEAVEEAAADVSK